MDIVPKISLEEINFTAIIQILKANLVIRQLITNAWTFPCDFTAFIQPHVMADIFTHSWIKL